MIVVTSVMDGFRSRIHENVRSVEADLIVSLRDPVPAQHYEAVVAELAEEMLAKGGPIRALSPCLSTKGLLVSSLPVGGQPVVSWQGVLVKGVDWDLERSVVPLDELLAANTDARLERAVPKGQDPLFGGAMPGILVAPPVASDMNLRTAAVASYFGTSRVSLHLGQPLIGPQGEWDLELANLDFEVTAGFESGRSDVDATLVYVDRKYLHELRYGRGSSSPNCSEVHVALDPALRNETARVKAALMARHANLHVESWEDRNVDLLNALKVEKRTMSLVLAILVLICTSLLFALLYMMVIEKTRDIGVLRSMGMSPHRVRMLFLGYGSALGLIGTTLGVSLGVLVVLNLNSLTAWLDRAFGLQVFSREVLYRFRDIPTVLLASQVWAIAALTMLVTVIAACACAFKASRYEPVRCLRHE